MTTPPTFADVMQIPAVLDDRVRPDQIDHNGHLNVMQYYGLGNLATWETVIAIGITTDYTARTGLTLFHAEQHLRFIDEMREGQRYTAHNRVIDCSDKTAHTVTYLLNRDTSSLAFVFEAVLLHVDLATRRATSFAPDVAAALTGCVETGRTLGWDPFVTGSMGARRPS